MLTPRTLCVASLAACLLYHSPAIYAADAITQEAAALYEAHRERGPYDNAMKGADKGEFSWFAWTCMHAEVQMYDVTGDVAYLERVLDWSQRLMANRADRRGVRDDIRGRLVKGWADIDYSYGLNYADGSAAGLLCHPMAEAVQRVFADESLRAAYGEQAALILRDVVDTMAEVESGLREGPSPGEVHYFDAFDDATSAQGGAPLNLQNAIGRTMLDLYLITGEAKYRDYVEKLANYMKHRMREVDDHVVWPYSAFRLRFDPEHVEDFSHGGLNVSFAFECYRAGIVFDERDMRLMANTLAFLFKGPDIGYADILTGSGTERSQGVEARWLVLGHFDERVRQNELGHLRYLVENNGPSRWLAAAAALAKSGLAVQRFDPLNIEPIPTSGQAMERSPLMEATDAGRTDEATALIENGAPLDAVDAWGRTALHHAGEDGELDMVRLLIKAGSDVEQRDRRSYTPLLAAAEAGQGQVAALLLKLGAERDAADQFNRTALHLAANQGHDKVVAVLLDAGADYTIEATGGSPIHGAAAQGHLAVVRRLLDAGENINRLDPRYQATPLYLAATYGRADVAEYLLSRGADLTLAMKHKRSPLDIAVVHGHDDIVRMLVAHGADPQEKDRFGLLAADRAEMEGHAELAAWLRQKAQATPAP